MEKYKINQVTIMNKDSIELENYFPGDNHNRITERYQKINS